jgi:hypothetical protein
LKILIVDLQNVCTPGQSVHGDFKLLFKKILEKQIASTITDTVMDPTPSCVVAILGIDICFPARPCGDAVPE